MRVIFKETLKGKISKNKYYNPEIKWNLRMMSKNLKDNGVIGNIAYGILRKVINACNRAVHGFEIKDEKCRDSL